MRGVDGTVTSIVANRYTVKCGNKEYTAYARGKLRRDGEFYGIARVTNGVARAEKKLC